MARSLHDRFEASVDRSGEHHRWLGSLNRSRGTGQLKVDGRIVTAHRVAWELARGPVPDGQRVRACLAEPSCVRIEHLSLSGAAVADEPSAERGTASASARRAARGGGSKRERAPGRWELAVASGIDERGRPVRSFRSFRGSEHEATKALAVFVAEVEVEGPAVHDSRSTGLTVTQLVDEFRSHLEHDKGRSPTTLLRYEGLQRRWIDPHLGPKRADRVMPNDIDSLLGRMRRDGQSRSSMNQTKVLLNGTFKWARRNHRVRSNPCREIEIPPSSVPPRELAPPDLETVRRLLSAAFELEFEFGVACHLGAVTGLRRGEICGLRWSRLHLDEAYLVVAGTVSEVAGKPVIRDFTKTRRTRRVSVDQHTIDLLHEVHRRAQAVAVAGGGGLAADAFVFSRTPGAADPLLPGLLSKRMVRLRRELGIDDAQMTATIQALRHWTQTTLSEAGYNPRQVALRGGHSEQLMNRIYVHRTNTAEREMAKFIGGLLA